ncbi:hypothetical protein B0T21DRAFT_141774 [Apiosordaria backusii]|uniref:Uncharacterized protein n=1 Tax=Apiosordaria backusii TaxID=314023 RepID=A0AA40BS43_9PEZI|nr:hypothetical protein B0T21DRAFT_141774 [Apiosordaria backusii]
MGLAERTVALVEVVFYLVLFSPSRLVLLTYLVGLGSLLVFYFMYICTCTTLYITTHGLRVRAKRRTTGLGRWMSYRHEG